MDQQFTYSVQVALTKAERSCAKQERSHQEMRDKLFNWGLRGDQVDEVLTELISRNFLSEERFARAFVSGRYRMKLWGRNKIIVELKKRRVSEPCIKLGLKEIDPEEYWENLKRVVAKKRRLIRLTKPYEIRVTLFRYCLQRGYESDLINDVLKEEEGLL